MPGFARFALGEPYGQTVAVALRGTHPQVLVGGAVGGGRYGLKRWGGGNAGVATGRDAVAGDGVAPMAVVGDGSAGGGGLGMGSQGHGLGGDAGGSGSDGLWFGRGGDAELAVVPTAVAAIARTMNGSQLGQPGGKWLGGERH